MMTHNPPQAIVAGNSPAAKPGIAVPAYGAAVDIGSGPDAGHWLTQPESSLAA
jgi:hypothetical protein